MSQNFRLAAIILTTLGVWLLPTAVSAAGTLSQGFTTISAGLPAGSLMVLEQTNQNAVGAATSAQASQLVGAVADKPLVELGSGTKQIQVVVSGLTGVLVSDINGPIKAGDKITASPVEGIGMKVGTSTEIVGTARSDFNTTKASTQSITDKNGKQKQIHIGTVAVQVDVSYYSMPENKLSAIVPVFLLRTGNAIAGKDVSPLRILIGFSCLVVGFLVAGIVLQVAVRSGIISLGRNPLAHKVLRQGLIDVMTTTVGLVIVTIIAFYLILKI